MNYSLPKAATWRDYFIELGEKREVSDEITLLFMSISVPRERVMETISKLSCDQGDSILLFYSKATKSMALSHNVMDLGNSNLFPESQLVSLSGFNSSNAIPMSFDIDSLFEDFTIEVPKIESVKEVKLKEDVQALKVPIKNPRSISSLPFILFPLFCGPP